MTGREEFVLRTVEERGVRFIRLWFVDVLGLLESFSIPVSELESALEEGVGLAGSSLEGAARLREHDVIAHPDPRTFQMLPWKPDSAVARMFCDVRQPDDAPFGGDSRAMRRRVLAHTDGLSMADAISTFRIAVEEAAHELGAYATFMPKPLASHPGSGMHLHISLFEDGRNAFHQADADEPLSPTGRAFLAAALVRVPSRRPDRAESTRFELRSPDPGCNPYMVLSLVLAAGLRGIERGYELQAESIDDDPAGAPRLPLDLREATELFDRSALAREALGDRLCDVFVANKRRELDDERRTVTEFDRARCLRLL